MKPTRTRAVGIVAGTAVFGVIAALATPANAATAIDTSTLRQAVTGERIQQHLEEFQAIADVNGANRAAGTEGHVQSAEYVEEQLAASGYETTRQYFEYDKTVFTAAVLDQVAPTPTSYALFDEFYPMDYSGEGDVTAPLTAVDVNLEGDRASTSGCEAADFTGFPEGHIALIQRGTCPFSDKATNAEAAGAAGVVVFNQGDDLAGDDRFGVVYGTLGAFGVGIPVVGTSFAIGEALVGADDPLLRLALDVEIEHVETFNVLADTGGRTDRTVVVGGHLDSVAEGPGINDNGSGTATILETALRIAELETDPVNRIRFAFWSGEEDGLIGSDYYVSQLSKRDLKDTAVNLNFDMTGSPNAVRFVYDGDGDAFGTSGPNGSGVVEDVFLDYFASQGLPVEATDFDGRSDYFGFIENGIPAGGLFTGAEGIKTAEQAAVFGGTAGEAYDPCYHSLCDTVDNVDPVVLEQMADAVAHATLTFGMTSSAVNGTDKGSRGGADALTLKGSKLIG